MSTWTETPRTAVLESTIENMKSRGFNVELVETKEEALEKVKTLIPQGAEVMTGASTTLNQIGFSDFLQSSESPWKNVHDEVTAENDDQKRDQRRRAAAASEYFLSSVNAISQTGELIAVDATGSRVTALPYAAGNVIFVASVQKIAGSLDAAMQRIREHVFPLENKRAQAAYGMGSTFGKWLIIEREVNPKRITVVLVKEALGF